MKKNGIILAVLMTFAIFTACKKGGGGGAPDVKPAVTPVGTNDGTPVSQAIGSAGGTVISSDGEIELIIPAGALTANTNIGIQPITNNAPGGRRKAYRCTPDGQQFAKDITIRFHYTEEDAATTNPEYMLMAFQTTDGKWQVIDKVMNDQAAKTISASVNHFTDFTAFDVITITPPESYVKTLEQVHLKLNVAAMSEIQGVLFIGELFDMEVVWKVNGITGGNLGNGTISGIVEAMYAAPGVAPTINPVTVSAEMEFPFVINGQRFNKGIVTALVYVVEGGYRVKIETETPINLGTGENFVTKDAGYFTVSMMSAGGATISDVENRDPTFQKTQESPVGCVTTWEVAGTGYIHLGEPSKLSAINAGGTIYVSIGLMKGHINPVARTACPGVQPGTNEIPIGGIDGQQFSFLANGQPQVVDASLGEFKIKYIITPEN